MRKVSLLQDEEEVNKEIISRMMYPAVLHISKLTLIM